ncbi:MAG: extracellular solute-binding protein [Acutalibacteraceae bacterium]
MAVSAFAGCGGGGTTSSENPSSSDAPASSGAPAAKQVTIDDIMADANLAMGDEDNVTLKVWGPQESLELLKKQCDDFVANFKKLGKTISIECVAQGESDAATNVKTDPAKAADVFGFASDQGLDLFKGNYVVPVRNSFVDGIKSNTLEGAYGTVLYKGADDETEIPYAYPETGDNGYALFYDKRELTEDDVKTMEGLMKVCNEKKKKFSFNLGDGFYACVVPFTGGGTLDISEDKSVMKLNYDYDKINAVAKAFVDVCGSSAYFKDENVNQTLVSGFKNGTHIAGVVGSWKIKDIEKVLGENMGVVKLPTINVDGEDKQIISLFGYKHIGVNAKTKYPITSQSLALYLTSEKAQKERCEEIGWGPSNKNLAESELVTGNVALKAIYDQQKYSLPQVNILAAWWTPTGTYGAYLVNPDKNHDDKSMKDAYDNMVENITMQ